MFTYFLPPGPQLPILCRSHMQTGMTLKTLTAGHQISNTLKWSFNALQQCQSCYSSGTWSNRTAQLSFVLHVVSPSSWYLFTSPTSSSIISNFTIKKPLLKISRPHLSLSLILKPSPRFHLSLVISAPSTQYCTSLFQTILTLVSPFPHSLSSPHFSFSSLTPNTSILSSPPLTSSILEMTSRLNTGSQPSMLLVNQIRDSTNTTMRHRQIPKLSDCGCDWETNFIKLWWEHFNQT